MRIPWRKSKCHTRNPFGNPHRAASWFPMVIGSSWARSGIGPAAASLAAGPRPPALGGRSAGKELFGRRRPGGPFLISWRLEPFPGTREHSLEARITRRNSATGRRHSRRRCRGAAGHGQGDIRIQLRRDGGGRPKPTLQRPQHRLGDSSDIIGPLGDAGPLGSGVNPHDAQVLPRIDIHSQRHAHVPNHTVRSSRRCRRRLPFGTCVA